MSNELALIRKDVVDAVEKRVHELQRSGGLDLPPNYSPDNALKSAWLTLQEVKAKNNAPALQACSRNSIANALFDMVIQGLTPAKDQVYFIAYGDSLQCQRSYFGNMALVRRVRPDAVFAYDVIYEGDKVTIDGLPGKRRVASHEQPFENINTDKVVGAYCMIEDVDGNLLRGEIMTFDQIKQSWKKSRTYKEGGSGVHQEFPDQMALRTVINRACKALINSSDDSHLLLRVQQVDEVRAEREIEAEVDQEADGEIIDIEPVPADEAADNGNGPEPEPEPESAEEEEPAGREPPF